MAIDVAVPFKTLKYLTMLWNKSSQWAILWMGSNVAPWSALESWQAPVWSTSQRQYCKRLHMYGSLLSGCHGCKASIITGSNMWNCTCVSPNFEMWWGELQTVAHLWVDPSRASNVQDWCLWRNNTICNDVNNMLYYSKPICNSQRVR